MSYMNGPLVLGRVPQEHLVERGLPRRRFDLGKVGLGALLEGVQHLEMILLVVQMDLTLESLSLPTL